MATQETYIYTEDKCDWCSTPFMQFWSYYSWGACDQFFYHTGRFLCDECQEFWQAENDESWQETAQYHMGDILGVN